MKCRSFKEVAKLVGCDYVTLSHKICSGKIPYPDGEKRKWKVTRKWIKMARSRLEPNRGHKGCFKMTEGAWERLKEVNIRRGKGYGELY